MVSLLSTAQSSRFGRAILSSIAGEIPQNPIRLCGLTFPNILGVAAGFDKEGNIARGLAMLGFGHVEIGTITPQYQQGNPRPRIFRLPKDGALINRMGFPSSGVEKALSYLASYQERNFILGISLGKQKETPLSAAVDDYIYVLQAVFPYADYIAVNISSPNTPELRKLQGDRYLGDLLSSLVAENQLQAQKRKMDKRPLLVKIAPDLTLNEVDQILQIITDEKIDGIIATNTTTNREGLKDSNRVETGGLSGLPLKEQSNHIIRHIAKATNKQVPIIGVGGVRDAADVQEKIDAGVSLVQLYTSLVYEGPGLAGRLLRNII